MHAVAPFLPRTPNRSNGVAETLSGVTLPLGRANDGHTQTVSEQVRACFSFAMCALVDLAPTLRWQDALTSVIHGIGTAISPVDRQGHFVVGVRAK
jgi:hypothetical protein